MKFTNIEKKSGTRYTVYVDDEYWYILDIEVIAQNGVKAGIECDEEMLDYLKACADTRRAKERALYLLGYRDHSRRELIEKLEKSVSSEIAIQTAQKMQDLGFIDDEKYARKLTKDLLVRKKIGARRAIYEMYRKGIDKDLAEEAIDELDIDSYDLIVELINKKYLRYLTDQKGIKKVSDALARMGHNYSDIKQAIGSFEEED